MNINFVVNYFTHALILFTFLSILFIFYISDVTRNAFITEISHLIHTAFDNVPKVSNKLDLSSLINAYSKPDKTADLHNKLLFKSLGIINLILWILFIVIIYILKLSYTELDMTHILIENAIIFSIIAIVEYLFFTNIALKFVPVEPSFIKKQLINILKKQQHTD